MSSDSPVSTSSPLPTDASLQEQSAEGTVATSAEPAADAKLEADIESTFNIESVFNLESEPTSEPAAEVASDTDTSTEPSAEPSAEPASQPTAAESTPESTEETPDFDQLPIEIPETLQVRLKSEDGKLLLTLPPDMEAATAFSWTEILQQFRQQLMARERFWQPNAIVHLMAGDRLLDVRQLQAIADTLQEAQLQLKWVYTSRRQTAVVAATAGYSVEQIVAASPLVAGSAPKVMDEPLYVQMTLRSGTEVRHNGTVIVFGDLNPGSSVVAEGDIIVWGRLRGVAHAGCKGNARCLIMALQMEPTQIRIADFVARAPETPPQYYPEVAYVSPQGNIRIARASDFQRPDWNQ